MTQEFKTVPGYGETIKEIGHHLGERKGLIIKRMLLVAWPALVFVGMSALVKTLVDGRMIDENSPYLIPAAIFGGCWLLFSVIYYAVMNYIFTIEKRIWIDSFFDKHVLQPAESWRIARRLFWPSLILSLNILVRYILPGVLLFVASLFIMYKMTSGGEATDYAVFVPFAGLAVVSIYFYVVQIKLRFLPFIFLDRYGSANFSYGGLFTEMRTLNASSKTALKSMVYDIGEGSLNTLISTVSGQLESAMGNLGGVGKVFGAVLGGAAQETGKQALSYAKIIAYYMLYKHVRSLSAEGQIVNTKIYELSK